MQLTSLKIMKLNEKEVFSKLSNQSKTFQIDAIFYDAYVAIYQKEMKIFCKRNKKYTK